MTARPKEIQRLIEWLRVPGRTLARRVWVDAAGNRCAFQRLVELSPGQSFAQIRKALDLNLPRYQKLLRVNDDSGDPIAVAEAFEAEFPEPA